MANNAAVELKVLISIVRESEKIAATLNDLKSLLTAVKSLDGASLQSVANQTKGLADFVRRTTEEFYRLNDARNSLAKNPLKLKAEVESPNLNKFTQGKGSPLIVLTDADVSGLGKTRQETERVKESLKGATGAGKEFGDQLRNSGKESADSLTRGGDAAERTRLSMEKLEGTVDNLLRGIKFLAGGWLGLESVNFLKSFADVAARTQVLGTVLHVVAGNAGYTKEEIDKVDRSVQRLGITAASSRQSLTQLLQSNLDLKFAPALARASQDLAVIAGWNSSETFQRLIVNIQQLDVMGLRWLGLVISREQAEAKFAASIGKTADQLTRRQQQEAITLAVIEKAKGLEGSYAAAMGDVGKQLTSLARYTENYQKAIGDGLLPSYLAIIEEITLLFKELTLSAQAMNSNTDASEALGDRVRAIASAIREAIIWITKHYEALKSLVEIYLAVKAAALAWSVIIAAGTAVSGAISGIAALIGVLTRLRLIYLAVSSGQIALTTGLGLLRASSAATIERFVAQTAAQTAMGASATAAAGEVAGLGVAVGAAVLPFTLLAGAIAAVWGAWEIGNIKVVRNTIAEWALTSDDMFAKMYRQLNGYKQATIQQVRDAEARLDQEEQRKADKDSGKGLNLDQFKITDKTPIGVAQNALLEQYEKEASLQTQYIKTQRSAATQEELNKAEKDLKDAKKRTEALEEGWTDLLNHTKDLPESRKAEEQARVARAKQFKEDQAFAEQYAQSVQDLFGNNVRFNAKGEVNSGSFEKAIGGFETQLQALTKYADDSDEAKKRREVAGIPAQMAGQVREGLRLLADAVKTPTDFSDFKKKLADFNKVATTEADKQAASRALQLASINAENYTRSLTAPIISRQKERYGAQREAVEQNLKGELDALKQNNQAIEAEESQAYQQGLLGIDTYYANRARRIQEEGRKEIQVQLEALETLRNQPTATAQEAVEKKNRIAEAERRLLLLQGDENQIGTIGLQIQQNALRQAQERYQLEQQVVGLQQDVASYYGGQEEALDQINTKYELLANRLKGVAGAEDAIAAARTKDQFEAILNFQNRRLQDQISLQRSRLDLERQKIERGVNAGEITTSEALARQNVATREELAIVQQEIDGKKLQKQLLETELAEQEKRLRDKLVKEGELTTDEIDARVRNSFFNLKEQVQNTGLEIEKLDGQVYTLLNQIDTYGKRLRQVFTDSLATAISDSLKNLKDAGNAFIQLGNSIRDQILGSISREASERITKLIVNLSSQKNPDGSVKEGTSIFDRLFNAIGLKTDRKPTGRKGDEIWVRPVVDTKEKLNLPAGAFDPASLVTGFVDKYRGLLDPLRTIFSSGGSGGAANLFNNLGGARTALPGFAGGGEIVGPGTGTSDSVIARVSNGEWITPEKQAKKYRSVLELIRQDKLKAFATGGEVRVQSIAPTPAIQRVDVGGGVSLSDSGSASVQPGKMSGQLVVTAHPDVMDMTLREWFEQEVTRQFSQR